MSRQLEIITIIVICILAGAEVDLFIPSFPELQETFQLTPLWVELTLGANFCSYCIGSLWAGDLGDRYGCRPLILGGLLIFIIGSLLCVYAPSFLCLIGGRILQGIGISGPSVLAFVIIANKYPIEKQQKLIGILNGIVTLAMAFAPVVGSYVNLWMGWQGNFMVLLGMGVLSLLLTYLWIPKDQVTPQGHSPSPLQAYLSLFKSSKSMMFTMAICCLVVPYWVFIGMAPILYMKDMGVELKNFGFYQGALAITFALVSLGSAPLLRFFGQYQCFKAGVLLTGLATILIGCVGFVNAQQPLIITGTLLLFSLGVVMPVNILYPLALETQRQAKGRMAAIIQASRLVMTAIGLEIAGYFYSGKFRPIAALMTITLILAFFFILYIQRVYKPEWQN